MINFCVAPTGQESGVAFGATELLPLAGQFDGLRRCFRYRAVTLDGPGRQVFSSVVTDVSNYISSFLTNRILANIGSVYGAIELCIYRAVAPSGAV